MVPPFVYQAKRVVFRSAYVLLTAAIAAGVPGALLWPVPARAARTNVSSSCNCSLSWSVDFAVFISFLGSTCCSLLGFVLPVVFYLRIFAVGDSDTERYDLKLLLAILFLGVFAVIAGFVTALSSFF